MSAELKKAPRRAAGKAADIRQEPTVRRRVPPADPSDLAVRRFDLISERQRFVQAEVRKPLEIFYWLNGILLILIFVFWAAEHFLPAAVRARELPPLITEGVLKTLIGAFAAQLGALAVTVGRQVFRVERE